MAIAGIRVAFEDEERELPDLGAPLPIEELLPGPSSGLAPEAGSWEVEIGFGKGRYLLGRAEADRASRFLGIEVAGEYYRLVRRRMIRRRLGNLLLVRGEALYLLSAVLPRGFASAVHVYFPDPWPKARHRARRLFDPETVDLVLGLLRPTGTLYFATDFLEYGDLVAEILEGHPSVAVQWREGPWQGEPRTNYEAKYIREGRPIRRFEIVRRSDLVDAVHPAAELSLRVATMEPEPKEGA